MRSCQDPNSLNTHQAELTDNTSVTSENEFNEENLKSQRNSECNIKISHSSFMKKIFIFLLFFSCKRFVCPRN